MAEARLKVVQKEPVGWYTVERNDANRALSDDTSVRYNIKYEEIVELAAAGEIVQVPMSMVTESALRNGVSYWALYTGIPIRCRMSKDRQTMLVFRQGVL